MGSFFAFAFALAAGILIGEFAVARFISERDRTREIVIPPTKPRRRGGRRRSSNRQPRTSQGGGNTQRLPELRPADSFGGMLDRIVAVSRGSDGKVNSVSMLDQDGRLITVSAHPRQLPDGRIIDIPEYQRHYNAENY